MVFFANLPGTDAGTFNFVVWVYAYNRADYDAANQNNTLVNAVSLLNGVTQVDGSVIVAAGKLRPRRRHRQAWLPGGAVDHLPAAGDLDEHVQLDVAAGGRGLGLLHGAQAGAAGQPVILQPPRPLS